MPNQTPILTLAFPLYRSGVFLKNITQQIDKLLRPGFEVLISDRHGLDNTLDSLEQRYGNDERFRFIRNYDEANWVIHHNDLVIQATGKYFLWISHDDSYSPEYCDRLLTYMEAHDDVLLTAGKMEVSVHPFYMRKINSYDHAPLSFLKGHFPYTVPDLIKLVFEPAAAQLWHGIFRRDEVLKKDLLMRWHPQCTSYVEFYWLLGIALNGRVHYLDNAVFTKHFHPLALHAKWTNTGHRFSENQFAAGLVNLHINNSPLRLAKKKELTRGIVSLAQKNKAKNLL